MSNFDMLDLWTRSIGKEALQAFQDDFSNLNEVSLCLVQLDGTPVTVASNRSLACFYIEGHNSERCAKEHQRMIDRMAEGHAPTIDSCYAGLTCFACPIFRSKEVVGAFFGGMVCTNSSDTAPSRLVRENATIMDQARLRSTVASLNSTIALLKNVRVATDNTVEETGAALKADFGLTSREIMVLDLIVQGRSNQDIADTLFISEKTVKTHVTNILKKTGHQNRYGLSRSCKKYFNS